MSYSQAKCKDRRTKAKVKGSKWRCLQACRVERERGKEKVGGGFLL